MYSKYQIQFHWTQVLHSSWENGESAKEESRSCENLEGKFCVSYSFNTQLNTHVTLTCLECWFFTSNTFIVPSHNMRGHFYCLSYSLQYYRFTRLTHCVTFHNSHSFYASLEMWYSILSLFWSLATHPNDHSSSMDDSSPLSASIVHISASPFSLW